MIAVVLTGGAPHIAVAFGAPCGIIGFDTGTWLGICGGRGGTVAPALYPSSVGTTVNSGFGVIEFAVEAIGGEMPIMVCADACCG